MLQQRLRSLSWSDRTGCGDRAWPCRPAASAAALGYDGKWVLHPSQIDAANQVFAPSVADYSRATQIIEAYSHATTVDQRGAVMLGEEMIDEASRKMAEAIMARVTPPDSPNPVKSPNKFQHMPIKDQTEQAVRLRVKW